MGTGTTLGEAQIPIRATLDKLDADLEGARSKVGKVIDGIVGNVQKVGGVALGIGGAAIGAIGGIGAMVGKMAIDAAPVEGLAAAFDGLAESAGTGSAEMLAALKSGSAGMIANRDLMMSFNQAASLVSLDFAQQLPDAMQYLGKVSASTGQDMGFLLDSLVKGVGRLSPMILDNLGIQVSMTEATEAWAKTNSLAKTSVIDNTAAMAKEQGTLTDLEEQLAVARQRQSEFTDKTKESSKMAMGFRIEDLTEKIAAHRAELGELNIMNGKTVTSTEDLTASMTKGQQQEAMMAAVMEKLAANTAAMPDVSELAAAKLAQFKATVQDTKDEIGLALLPVLTTLMGVLATAGETVLPFLTQALDAIAPVVTSVAEAFGKFIGWVLAGEDPLAALTIALYSILPPEVAQPIVDAIAGIRDGIQAIVEAAAPYVEMALQWIGQNVQLSDALIALGIAIAAVVLPALWAVIAAVAPIVLTVVGLIAVIALLRAAWESDFLGIRTALLDAWDQIQPALAELWEWLQVNVPAAIETLVAFWQDTLQPALAELWEWLAVNVPAAIETLVAFWQETLLPAITEVWAFIDENVIPLLEALGEVIGATLVLAGEALAGLWEKTLLPALQTAGTWIRDTFGPILETFLNWLTKITGGLDGVKSALSTVKDWLGKVAEKIKAIKLPDWLDPGSPTPFEIGLLGIGDAARRLATIEFPGMAASLSVPQFAAAGMGAGEMVSAPRGGPGGGYQITNIFEANSVRSEEDIYRLNEEMDRSMALRGLQRNIG